MNTGSCRKWQCAVCANVPLQLSSRSRAVSSITPRTNELVKLGVVREMGRRPCRRSGRMAISLGGRSMGAADIAFSAVAPREEVLWVLRWQSEIVCALTSLRIFPRVFRKAGSSSGQAARGRLLLITLSRRTASPVLEDRQHVARRMHRPPSLPR